MRKRTGSGLHSSNMSRREFLQICAAVGLVAGAGGGCTGNTAEDGAKSTTLKLYGTGTLDIEKGWERLRADLNIDLLFTDNRNDTGPVITQMIAGNAANDYHLGGLQGGAERELAAAGVILPWNLEAIPNWQSVWPWVKNIPYAKWEGGQYGLPVVVNADSMIYLPDKVGAIDSYAAVFDPELKGRTAMEDAWINSVIFTAMYLKHNGLASIDNAGDLTPTELESVMTFLIDKKKAGQFRKFWNGWEDGLQLITSGQVWVMTGWEPIVYAAQKRGVNAQYAVPKEGYEGWSNDLLLHVGAKDDQVVERAHAFANWELGGYYGCELSQLRGYVVPTDHSVDYARAHSDEFDAVAIERTAKHVQEKFMKMGGQVSWQNVRPTHYKLYEDWWSRLRSA